MAKIKIGKIPVYKGEYDNNIRYDRLNQVTYLGTTFLSIVDDNLGHPPAEKSEDGGEILYINTNYWDIVAKGIDNVEERTATDNSMGYKILKKNKSFIEQVTEENTIYEIRYNFTLTEDITIPANCVLEFNGGSISGTHTLTGNNTYIGESVNAFESSVVFSGTWNIPVISTDMFKDLSSNGALRVINPLMFGNSANHIDVYIKNKGYDYIMDMNDSPYTYTVEGQTYTTNGFIGQYGLNILSNTTIYLSATIKVVASKASGYRLFNISGSNVQIIGGELYGDLDDHTYGESTVLAGESVEDSCEYCHGIGIYSASNVTIKNVHIHHFPGDCIGFNGTQTDNNGIINCSCRGVNIINCKIHDCRRNGIAITNSEDSVIEGCEIYNVVDTHPNTQPIGMENAIDIEPNKVSSEINGYAEGIVIRNCKIHNCVYGIRTIKFGDGDGKLGTDIRNVLLDNIKFDNINITAIHFVVGAVMNNIIINDTVNSGKTMLYTAYNTKIDKLNIVGGTIVLEDTLELSNSNVFCGVNVITTSGCLIMDSCNMNIGSPTNNGVINITNSNVRFDSANLEGTVSIKNSVITTGSSRMISQSKAVTLFIFNNIFRSITNNDINFFWCNTDFVMSGLISNNIFECKNVIESALNIAKYQPALSGDNNIFKEPKDNSIGYLYMTSIKRQVPKLVTKSLLSSLQLSAYEKGTTTFCQDHNGGAQVYWNGTAWVDATGATV